ncbi:MAG: DUF169 domain-containing protein, partial [Deltaproteobacteria bacterium]|nr:DUF169 domain-containing protein [Deltaproteobacteria bacterium]
MNETLSKLLESLGLTEEPYGIFYTDIEPTEGFVPTVGQMLSLELEHQGKIDFQEVFKNFSCVLGKLWLARRFFTDIRPRPAPARFCVFKPISHFSTSERPELVTFFARGEVMTGLCNLAAFVTDDFEIVATPFG